MQQRKPLDSSSQGQKTPGAWRWRAGHPGEEVAMSELRLCFGVRDLAEAICFYSDLFAAAPAVIRLDHAEWWREDGTMRFRVFLRERTPECEAITFCRDVHLSLCHGASCRAAARSAGPA